MKAVVPFKRIAISPGVLPNATSVATAQETLLMWGQNALKKGADALMLRERFVLDEVHLKCVETLVGWGKLPVLLNSDYLPIPDNVSGIHRTSEYELAPPPDNPDVFYGLSCHTMEEVLQAASDGYHYIFFSPIYPTESHPHSNAKGLEALRLVCAKVPIVVFALGGITNQKEKACLSAGAHGIAGIRMFI